VTGGAGFIGSHLVDALAARRESVVVCDDLRTGRLANLERAISLGGATFIYADPETDCADLRGVIASSGFDDVDCIYHFVTAGADAGPPAEVRAVDGASIRTLEAFIEMCLEYGSRLVLASSFTTGTVAGASGLFCDETVARLESIVAEAVRRRLLDARVVRFANCYGPRLQMIDDSFITALLEAKVAGRPMDMPHYGDQVRSMTYVSDAIEQLQDVLEQPPSAEPITIATNGKHSIDEIAGIIASLERSAENRVGFRSFLPQRGGRRASSRAATSLKDGLRMTFAWFSKNSRLFA